MRRLLPAALFMVAVAAGMPAAVQAASWWTPVASDVRTAPTPACSLHGVRLTISNGRPNIGADLHLSQHAWSAAVAGGGCLVASGSEVWRWNHGWTLSLALFPNLPDPIPPAITGLATMPSLTGAAYLATAGDGALVSTDGGITWYRAQDGLPPDLSSVEAAPSERGFVATANGRTYLHVLAPLPSPTAYPTRHPEAFWLSALLAGTLSSALALALLALGTRVPGGRAGRRRYTRV